MPWYRQLSYKQKEHGGHNGRCATHKTPPKMAEKSTYLLRQPCQYNAVESLIAHVPNATKTKDISLQESIKKLK